MKIIFASSVCSKEMYKEVFELRNKKLIDPMQKFLEQLVTGIARNNIDVISISSIPVSASSTNKKFFKKKYEEFNNIKYTYLGFINGKILRYLTSSISCFFNTLILLKKQKKEDNIILICDPLVFHISKPARLAARLCNIKTIAIVTDVPIWATEMKQHKYSSLRKTLQNIYEKLSMKEINKYDGYINLTKYMSRIVNPDKKPEIIIEGSVDDNIKITNYAKENKRIFMYCGGVYEKYGLNNLVEAFIDAKLHDTELHIYGEGSYVEKLNELCKINKNIKYCGCKLNSEIIEIEKKATLLINPRFSNEEYTKYSFPSKTLEYMSSGTPVLTTRLKGIPDDYQNYLFWFDDESVKGMSDKLKEIAKIKEDELQQFGLNAQKYVLENKNNIIQGEKIIEFIELFYK